MFRYETHTDSLKYYIFNFWPRQTTSITLMRRILFQLDDSHIYIYLLFYRFVSDDTFMLYYKVRRRE